MVQTLLEETISFHGHLCPGVAFGFRAAMLACQELHVAQKAMQQTYLVIAENDLCGLDGIQYVTGCTVGNDGLLIRNMGKQAFSFINKKTGQGIRISLQVPLWDSNEPLALHAKVKTGQATEEEKKQFIRARTKRAQELLALPDEQLLKWTRVTQPVQEKVRLFPASPCSLCQEAVMEPWLKKIGGIRTCPSCDIYENLKNYLRNLMTTHQLAETTINITGTVLTAHEAIGSPDRNDFPLQKGKEKLMQAEIDGFLGQAYTDMPYEFSGKLQDILDLPLDNNYRRAVFISTLNALMAKLGLTDHTIHCKDDGPSKCAKKLAAHISEQYGTPKIALFGLQPAMADRLSRSFNLRIFDLDPDNIGQKKFNTVIESGDCDLAEVEAWADLFLVTGSTLANDTLPTFLTIKKPVLYYGTTIAGAAKVLGLERFCAESC